MEYTECKYYAKGVNMIKKVYSNLLVVMLVLALCSCGAPEESPQSTVMPTATPKTTPVQSPSPSPAPNPTVISTPIPVLRSYTTGLPVAERTPYKPVGVMIENSSSARPQYGLQAADIVYEAPVEGCTRLFCIYNDVLPEKVGPVRSARIYFIKMQQEWDCAYIHFGGPENGKANVYLSSSDHIKTRVNLIKGKYNDYYWRDKKKKAPHNAYTDVQKCQTLMKEESKVRTFQYADELQYTGKNIKEISLPFYSGKVTYKYDAAKDVFIRYMGGKPFIDAETKAAVEVKNLIVQYSHFYHGNEAKGRWLCDLTGSGEADFFIGGKHIQGTWKRESYDSPTIYKDSYGEEIILQPGNTWITVHPNSKEITVNY